MAVYQETTDERLKHRYIKILYGEIEQNKGKTDDAVDNPVSCFRT